MTINELMNYLQFEDSIKSKILQTSIKNENNYINLFYNDEAKFFKLLENEFKDDYELYLYLYLKLALNLYDSYKKKNIDEQIYFDTIDDIRIWCNECKKETGIFGLKEIYWINEHLRERIYKLGRLQFQKKIIDDELKRLEISSKSGYVYFVHIPSGEPLNKKYVIDSYRRAKSFYNDEMVFMCDSWVLSYKLKDVLEANSNILDFASDYRILEYSDKNDPIKRYLIKDSKLYNKIIEYEINHQNIGDAIGIYYFK